MKAFFSRGDKPAKNEVEDKAPRSTGDVGPRRNAEMGSENLYVSKYGFYAIMKKGMAFKCHSPIIVRPGAFSWTEY